MIQGKNTNVRYRKRSGFGKRRQTNGGAVGNSSAPRPTRLLSNMTTNRSAFSAQPDSIIMRQLAWECLYIYIYAYSCNAWYDVWQMFRIDTLKGGISGALADHRFGHAHKISNELKSARNKVHMYDHFLPQNKRLSICMQSISTSKLQ